MDVNTFIFLCQDRNACQGQVTLPTLPFLSYSEIVKDILDTNAGKQLS
jgi:hypothetical protein